jgi:ribosomal-protein-alanine N-acetyltransferase
MMAHAPLVEIRRATLGDLDAVEAMEKRIFTTPWSRAALIPELRPGRGKLPLLASFQGKAVGYALVWVIHDELHLVTIGVEAEHRRRGIARALLQAVVDHPQAVEARIMTLEVRMGNEAARAFYRGEGFTEIAVRPRYYPDNREDAVVMLKALAVDDPEEGPRAGNLL